jgi:hypothetical protein
MNEGYGGGRAEREHFSSLSDFELLMKSMFHCLPRRKPNNSSWAEAIITPH